MARPEVLAFLAEIKEHPLDRTSRLVLADWLEERDDPRGSLVRLQVEQARPDLNAVRRLELGDQERQLIQEHQEVWLGPLQPRIVSWAFQRGLVQLQSTPDRIIRETSPELLESEELAWVETIRLYGDTASPADYAATRSLQGVRVLDCSWTRMQAGHLAGLARAAPFPFLGELILNACTIGPVGLAALAESLSFPRLVTLRLSTIALGDDGLAILARSRLMAQLQILDLRNNRISRAGVAALAAAVAPNLRELSLMHNELDSDIAGVLIGSPTFERLHVLDLRGNRLDNAVQQSLRARFGPRVRFG